MELRWLNTNDVEQLAALEQVCFSQPWSRQALEQELTKNPLACYFGCFEGDTLLGYAGAWLVVDEVHITNVAVAPEYRRQGIGKALVSAMLEWAAHKGAVHMELEVRAGNQGAIALYSALGFHKVGRRPNYYSQPQEDAILMNVELPAKE